MHILSMLAAVALLGQPWNDQLDFPHEAPSQSDFQERRSSARREVAVHFPAYGKTTVDGLRVRDAPFTSGLVLHTFSKKGSSLKLFAYSAPWYRITPIGFEPTAWVATAYVEASSGVEPSNTPEYYLRLLTPPRLPTAPTTQQVAAGSRARQQRPPRFGSREFFYQFGLDTLGCLWSLFLLVLFFVGIPMGLGWLAADGAEHFGLVENGDGVQGLVGWATAIFLVGSLVLRYVDPRLERIADVGLMVIAVPSLGYGLYKVFVFLHYLVTRHPIEREVRAALKKQRRINLDRLGSTAFLEKPRWRFQIRNRHKRANELRDLLRTERKLLDEALGRERMIQILRKL